MAFCSYTLCQFHPTNVRYVVFGTQKHLHDNPSFTRKCSRFRLMSPVQDPSHHKSDQSISKSCTHDPFNKFLFIIYVRIHNTCISTIQAMLFSSLLSLHHETWSLSIPSTAKKTSITSIPTLEDSNHTSRR